MTEPREDHERYVVRGTIREAETDRPLGGLIVRAYDRDWVVDDVVGFASTDVDGRFAIRFDERAYRDVSEARPDLYLKIYDALGVRLLHETTDSIRWNASREERYAIRIPARALDPRNDARSS